MFPGGNLEICKLNLIELSVEIEFDRFYGKPRDFNEVKQNLFFSGKVT